MKRFLITTALESTWRDDQAVLFLGEWCRRYSRRARWAGLDAEVVPYHWDDRERLHADYRYLSGFHERLLADLASKLNRIHGVDHGVRYWRIVIGPWLGYFVQILFDRWSSLQTVSARTDVSGTIVLTGGEELFVPNDMGDLSRLLATDEWNHYIYGRILQRFANVPVTPQVTAPEAHAPRTERANRRTNFRRALATAYSRVCAPLARDRDGFFFDTLLPADEARLHLRLGQFPQHWRTVLPARVPIDRARRSWVLEGDCHSAFESCARQMIPEQLPAVSLEGYRAVGEQVARLPWPRHPSVIWVNNAENSDEVFKVWAAQKVEDGSPLVINQHGGHYGTGRWSFNEDHETAISDRYLSWGWCDRPNVIPFGQTKPKRSLGVRHAEQPSALLVLAVAPRYSYWMYSIVVAAQWLDYQNDQYTFIEHLPPAIQRAVIVRTSRKDEGWDQSQRWGDRFPQIAVDAGCVSITQLIRRSRIYISTYNATTYLEAFTMDVPTVIYWNPRHWEVRESAAPYFDELTRVGIFHDTPEGAARHVAAIWDDVDTWWRKADVRAAVRRFKDRYCHVPQDLLGEIAGQLQSVMAEPRPIRGELQ